MLQEWWAARAPAGARMIRAAMAVILVIAARPGAARAGADEEIHVHGFFQAMLRQNGDDGVLQNWSVMGNPFDNFQLFVNTDAVVSDHVAVFTRVRFDDAANSAIGLDGAYVQFQNFSPADLYVQLGKVPSAIGSFQERSYPDKNPLVGLPLMYYYHTTLRSDVIPQGPADLWAVKGKNQYGFVYPSAASTSSTRTGMPTTYDPCWDYGVVALGTWHQFEGRIGLMNGSPGHPETGEEWNPAHSPEARLGWVPAPWMRLGASFGRGEYLPSSLASQLPAGKSLSDYTQTVYALDGELTHGWWELRSEWSENIFKNPGIPEDLRSWSYYVEGRRTLRAGLYSAIRWDNFTYGEIADPFGGRGRWGDNVSRVEAGVGYWAEANLLFKADLQLTRVGDGGFKAENRVGGLQAVLRF